MTKTGFSERLLSSESGHWDKDIELLLSAKSERWLQWVS